MPKDKETGTGMAQLSKNSIPYCTSQDSTWQMLTKAHANWVTSLKQRTNEDDNDRNMTAYIDIPTPSLADNFLAALSPSVVLFKGKDWGVMKRLISSTIEAVEEEIITEDEASAVLEYIATKFIARRFDEIMQQVFDSELSHKYSFRGIKGTVK